MEELFYKSIEPLIEDCFETARTMIEHIPKERGAVTNKNEETFGVKPTDFYTIAKELFSFVATLRGNGGDYAYLGYSESILESILRNEDLNKSFHDSSEECTVNSRAFQKALKAYYKIAIQLLDFSDKDLNTTNPNREKVHFASERIKKMVSDLLGIVVAYRGTAKDYSQLVFALEKIDVPENQRIAHYKRKIHNYQQALKLGKNFPNIYNNLCLNMRELADLLEDEEERRLLYATAIEYVNGAIRMEPKDRVRVDVNYLNRGWSYLGLAQLSGAGDERISLYKRAIANLKKACNLNRESATNYFYLAESEEGLAEEFYLTDEAKELKQRSLEHYKRSLRIVDNPITRRRVQKLEQSISG